MNINTALKIIAYIFLILGSFIFIFPLFWTLLSSFKGVNEAIAVPPVWFPQIWEWSNYLELFRLLPFGYFYWNTMLLVFFRIVCAILFSTMAAYGFAKIPFFGRRFFFSLVVLQIMIPPAVFIYPQYRILLQMNALNTIFALIFPGLVSAFGTFLMRQAFLSLPSSLEEAAVMDGCNRWQVYSRVYLPLLESSMSALSIFTIIFVWKDLMWPMIVNTDIKKMPLTAGIMYLKSGVNFISDYGIMMAGAIVVTIPLVVLYCFFQKSFQTGIATTVGIK